MDRGAWRDTVHRVAKSQSWLKRLSVQTWHLLGRSCTIYWVCRHFPKTNILHRAAEKELKNWPCLSVQTRTPISSRGEYTQQPVCGAVKGPVSSPTHLPSVSAEKFLYQDRNLGGKSFFFPTVMSFWILGELQICYFYFPQVTFFGKYICLD